MKSSIGLLIKKLVSNNISRVLFAATLALLSLHVANAQQYVSSTSTIINTEALASANVLNPTNAQGAPDGQSATITASGVVVNLGLGTITYSSDAALNLGFSPALPAGKTTYVRISELTQSGLNLDLSSLLNVLGLLQNNTIRATSNGGTTTQELVRDGAGNLYIAVTPTNAYTQVTVTLNFDNATSTLIGLALGSITLGVEHAVNLENATLSDCDAAALAFTSVNPHATGISLTLTDALQNPQNAIDGSLATASLLQNGTVGVVSEVSQTIYLGKTAPGTNQVFAVVSKPGALANLNVLDNVTIQAYLGSSPAGSAQTVRGLLLSLDLLTLFSNDGLARLVFTPGAGNNFDRIVVRSVTIAGANLFTGIQIHEIGTRPPVVFTGGTVTPGRVGDAIVSDLFSAKTGGIASFSIQCGLPADYTYTLFEVSAPGGRTLAGTLPSTITLNADGTFSGTPASGQNNTYTFDVKATNQLGQSAVASFTLVIEAALPVTLISFKALSEGQTASLSWSTSEETNSDRFDIERSQNGKNWRKIGSVASHKESSSNQYYSFADPSPLRGDNFYRLKMVDLDETFAYSRIEALNFKGIALVYPNPASSSDNLTINVGDWSKVKQVRVVNAAGKVVFEATNALLSGINARNLVSGAYMIQVTHIDGSISAQKFVRL